jgi:hypothetical protein
MQKDGWLQRTLLFADGEHGSALQVHALSFLRNDDGFKQNEECDTGIVMVWSRKNWHDKGRRRYYFDKVEYPDFNDAAYAWRAAGMPVITPVAQDYLKVT